MTERIGDVAVAIAPEHVLDRHGDLRSRRDGARCFGAVVRNLITGELTAYVAKATGVPLPKVAVGLMLGKKLTIVLLDNRGYGCINRLQMGTGGANFNPWFNQAHFGTK